MKQLAGKKFKAAAVMAPLCALLLSGKAAAAPNLAEDGRIAANHYVIDGAGAVKAELVRSGKQTAAGVTLTEKGPE